MNKSIFWHLALYLFLAVCILPIDMYAASDGQFTLVIDAGHGGHDPGAVGKISKEKDINLEVALGFGGLVEKFCPDVKVVYTRKTDVFVELNERAAIANRCKANLFISIHTNAAAKSNTVKGFSTYTLGMARASENLDVAKRENAVITYEKDYREKYEGFNPNSPESYIMFEFMQDKNMAQSVELAQYIQENVVRTAERENMGVHQAGFLVLRKTSMPSCLVELGFISTPEEEEFLNTDDGCEEMARGIFNAFAEYRSKYDRHIVTPFEAPKRNVEKETRHALQQERNVQSERKPVAEAKKPVQQEQKVKNTTPAGQKLEPSAVKQKDAIAATTVLLTEIPKDGEYYAVQIFMSQKMLPSNDPQFKGVQGIYYYKDGDNHKYVTNVTRDANEVKTAVKMLKEQFPGAFVIRIKDGKRI